LSTYGDDEDDRTLTELEFVEVAARRVIKYLTRAQASAFTRFADELMTADVSELNGGGDTRLGELRRLRRLQT
jgi:hypothetical protein